MTDLLDFDTLSRLAQEDPEAFEEYRRTTLEGYFSSLPEEQSRRARQLQWQIDGSLRKCKSPEARFNKMVEMFWESTLEFNDALAGFKK